MLELDPGADAGLALREVRLHGRAGGGLAPGEQPRGAQHRQASRCRRPGRCRPRPTVKVRAADPVTGSSLAKAMRWTPGTGSTSRGTGDGEAEPRVDPVRGVIRASVREHQRRRPVRAGPVGAGSRERLADAAAPRAGGTASIRNSPSSSGRSRARASPAGSGSRSRAASPSSTGDPDLGLAVAGRVSRAPRRSRPRRGAEPSTYAATVISPTRRARAGTPGALHLRSQRCARVGRVDVGDDVDEVGHRVERAVERGTDLAGVGHGLAGATERLDHVVVRRAGARSAATS